MNGVRLAPGAPLSSSPGLVLAPVAVEARGRRRAGAPVVDEAWVRACAEAGAVAALDHAGPAAAQWSEERAVACAEVADFASGRRARALDDAAWGEVVAAYARAASLCRVVGVPCALVVDDDGLLHRAWSPLGREGEPDDARVLEVHRACGGVDAVIAVEDLAPGGLDATDGVALARKLVGQGARRLYASAGTGAFPPLRRRTKGGTASSGAHVLASAAWLVGRVDADVVAVVPRGDPVALAAAAPAFGLAGVVVEEPA